MTRKFLHTITLDNGSVQAVGFDNIQAADLPNSGVVPGAYTNSTVTVDEKGRVTAAASGAGGGGTATLTGADASRPAASTNGQLYLPNDNCVIYRDTGSAWGQFGPLFPLEPVVSGDFAWINQGTATISATNGTAFLYAPANASAQVRIRKKTAPSAPYTITACFLHFLNPGSTSNCGLLFRQSSDGKLHYFRLYLSVGNIVLSSAKFTDASTFSASYSDVTSVEWAATPVFLRIADDNTNRVCSFSADGQNWLVFHTVGRTDFLTADEVGFGASSDGAGGEAGMTLLSWKQG